MCLVLKAPDRECYAVMVGETLYIPVLSTVFESGTNNPIKVANRLVTNGLHGFWTVHVGKLGWRLVSPESLPKHWKEAVLFLTSNKSVHTKPKEEPT